jgi:hypothetical protein
MRFFTGSLKIPVVTARPWNLTVRGRPTFTEITLATSKSKSSTAIYKRLSKIEQLYKIAFGERSDFYNICNWQPF